MLSCLTSVGSLMLRDVHNCNEIAMRLINSTAVTRLARWTRLFMRLTVLSSVNDRLPETSEQSTACDEAERPWHGRQHSNAMPLADHQTYDSTSLQPPIHIHPIATMIHTGAERVRQLLVRIPDAKRGLYNSGDVTSPPINNITIPRHYSPARIETKLSSQNPQNLKQ